MAWINKREQQLKVQRDEIVKMTPGNQRVEMLANVTYQALAEMEARVNHLAPGAKYLIAAAKQSTVAANDFVASFKDNPARRAVSLFIGSVAGIIFAGIAGIDIFAAIDTAATAGAGTGTTQAIRLGQSDVARDYVKRRVAEDPPEAEHVAAVDEVAPSERGGVSAG